jgi:hypothetical protein
LEAEKMDIQALINQYPYLFAIAFYLGIFLLASRLTGWRALAEHYPLSSPFTGKPHRFQTAWMRWSSHYGNALTAGANAQGLYLSVLFLLRIGHPPLFIPWSDITSTEISGGFSRRVELRFRRLPNVPVIITRDLADNLAKESNGVFTIQGPNRPQKDGA